MEPNNKTPVYYETAAYARENGELELFRLSHRTNIACKNDIQDAISRHFDGIHLDKETAKEVLDQYGAERVSIVLAATVQYKSWDGRFSSSNKDWAFSVHLPEGQSASGFDRRSDYIVDSHPAVLDGFIWQARKEIRERQNPAVKKETVQESALRRQQKEGRTTWKDEVVMHMEEKQYAVLLTETQDVKVMACNPDKDIFDIGRETIGCDWIELVEAELLAKDGLLMMIDEEGKLKPGGALINATASALYGTERHGDPIMGNAVIVRTTGENLELLTAGEAEQLAARMEAIRDRALQKIAEAFARRSAHKQERSASAPTRRQPCRKGKLER